MVKPAVILTTMLACAALGLRQAFHIPLFALLVMFTASWLVLHGFLWVFASKLPLMRRLVIFGALLALLATSWRLGIRQEDSEKGSFLPVLSLRWKGKRGVLPETGNVVFDSSTPKSAPEGVLAMSRFMGPDGKGVVQESDWQSDWKSYPPREAWRIVVGEGWSGFAVLRHRAVTQEQRGEQECVTCYDISSGRLLWSHADSMLFDEEMGGMGPRATPTIDVENNIVYSMGAKGLLNSLDLSSGAVRWKRYVIADTNSSSNLKWGKSCSPLLEGDLVVCSGGQEGSSLIAYHQKDGSVAWKSPRADSGYSSPVSMTLDGIRMIVNMNQNSVSGYDPGTGAVLWTFDWPSTNPKVGQPVQAGPNRLLVTSSYGVKSHLLEIKSTADRRFDVTSVWDSGALRTKFSSASLFGRHAYALDEGILACVDMETGERIWREGRYGFGQQIRVGNDWLLIQAEKGFAALVRDNRERLEEVARLDAFDSKTWNPPTLAGRWLLLRNNHEAVCYELPAR